VSHSVGRAASALLLALDAAAHDRRPLLLLAGDIRASNEILPALFGALDADPMFGTAQPLFADGSTDAIWSPWEGDPHRASIARDALPHLPTHVLTAELPSACFLIRASLVPVLAEMMSAAPFHSFPGLMTYLLCKLRRLGFRNICCTRAVIPTSLSPNDVYLKPDSIDLSRIRELFPDHFIARQEDSKSPLARLAKIPSSDSPRRLVLDCRALGPVHNGTSQNILGHLFGFSKIQTSWQIDVLCEESASVFHQLQSRFPDIGYVTEIGKKFYTAAFFLSQPWNIDVINQLHEHALVIGFNFLDTIAWDVTYPASPNLKNVWSIAARYADVITYISQYSQNRFLNRFSRPRNLIDIVAYPSLSPQEYIRRDIMDARPLEHVLLFGNSYDHKDISPTLDVLVRAFPLQNFVVIGGKYEKWENVKSYYSGVLQDIEVHHLIATAKVIIFPSFYEGFGLPVVEGLSYGRPVLVRQSALWDEIGGNTKLPGRLVPFADRRELVERLGRLLMGQPVEALRLGGALSAGEEAPCWATTAAATLQGLEAALPGAPERWLERDLVLSGWKA
jgi:hypothetical protein